MRKPYFCRFSVPISSTKPWPMQSASFCFIVKTSLAPADCWSFMIESEMAFAALSSSPFPPHAVRVSRSAAPTAARRVVFIGPP